jgi:hypothetical protein
VDDEGSAAQEGLFKGHGQPRLAEGQAIRAKAALRIASTRREGHRGKAARSVEALIDVKGIVGGVQGAIAGRMAQAALGVGHERLKVADIGAVEGLGQLGQDELAPAGDLGGHDAGGVAPIVLTDLGRTGGGGSLFRYQVGYFSIDIHRCADSRGKAVCERAREPKRGLVRVTIGIQWKSLSWFSLLSG